MGRWSAWRQYSLDVPGAIYPEMKFWSGGSSSYYIADYNGRTDHRVWSPQVEYNNLVPMKDDAEVLNPDWWFELSTWDGDEDMRAKHLALSGVPYSPERYKASTLFGMWLLRPRLIREFRGWTVQLESHPHNFDYFSALHDAVNEIYDYAEFWENGELVEAPEEHPWQHDIPAFYENRKRWFMLKCDVNPPRPWQYETEIKVFALALKLGNRYMIYAHAPLGDTEARIEVPGFGTVQMNVSQSGTHKVLRRAAPRRRHARSRNSQNSSQRGRKYFGFGSGARAGGA
jgi:hypothetical protein